jgi:ATP-dependent helicase HrpB
VDLAAPVPLLTMLPIDPLEPQVRAAVAAGPLVLSAPTGSGKSTRVPLWCPRPVLVVEPRRMACRGLAARVAELEGVPLGGEVGYIVRDDHRATKSTSVCFVTTGVALALAASGELDRYASVVLDEFHERSLDLDLLLALLQGRDGLVVMSATLEGDRVAAHLGGVHLSGEGRQHPVHIRYTAGPPLPDAHGLEERVLAAIRTAPPEGDVLVFLPGRGEIRSVAARLGGLDADVLELHGGLTLAEQGRAFRTGPRRRIICSTNVAETSVTLPGIRVVVDSGLVRRTHYHRGRAFLARIPIARDSADQRAGRAGRTAPGVAIRLWAERAPLDANTPPEVHRESLVPLVLAAAASGAPLSALRFLDPPKEFALVDARQTLTELGAIDGDRITARGERLFGLPLDAELGRLLVEAEGTPSLGDAIDLVAALHTPRRLFGPRPEDPEDDLRHAGCDAVALIRAVREGDPRRHRVDRHGLNDARRTARRLRRAFRLPPEPAGPVDRTALIDVVLAAWPRCAYVARRRKRRVAFANGGTEVRLGDRSAVSADAVEAVLALDSRGLGGDGRSREILLTAAMPVSLRQLYAVGRGRDQLTKANLVRGRVVSTIDRVYAGQQLGSREAVPQGALAREAIADLFLRGSLFRGAAAAARERLEALTLHARLSNTPTPPPLEAWVADRLTELGVEDGADVALLSRDDLLPPVLDPHAMAELDRRFPRRLSIDGVTYRIRYELGRRRVVLERMSGRKGPLPSRRLLPDFGGWPVSVDDRGTLRPVR